MPLGDGMRVIATHQIATLECEVSLVHIPVHDSKFENDTMFCCKVVYNLVIALRITLHFLTADRPPQADRPRNKNLH